MQLVTINTRTLVSPASTLHVQIRAIRVPEMVLQDLPRGPQVSCETAW